MQTSIFAIILYKLYIIAIPKHLEPLLPKITFISLPFTPNLYRVIFYNRIEFLPYSTAVKLLPFLILIIGSYLSLKTSLWCLGVITSFISAVARKFIQGRHPNRYPERLPILASAKQLYNHPSVIYSQWLTTPMAVYSLGRRAVFTAVFLSSAKFSIRLLPHKIFTSITIWRLSIFKKY